MILDDKYITKDMLTKDSYKGNYYAKKNAVMYDSTLDVAMEVIQDFLNCDPMDIGKLQANTYDTVHNIEKEIKENE